MSKRRSRNGPKSTKKRPKRDKSGDSIDRRKIFVREYLIDLNATQAAIRAGYSKKTAKKQGHRLSTNVHLKRQIDEALAKRAERLAVTADRVVNELRKVAFSNMREFSEWGPNGVKLKPSTDLSAEAAACVAEVSQTTSESGGSIKFKLHDKVQALQLIGRHLKMFTDKREHTGPGGAPIQVQFYLPEADEDRSTTRAANAIPS